MPAPKGNKNAAKDNPKVARFGVRVQPSTREQLEKLAEAKNISISQLLENMIVEEYLRFFKKK